MADKDDKETTEGKDRKSGKPAKAGKRQGVERPAWADPGNPGNPGRGPGGRRGAGFVRRERHGTNRGR